MCGAGTVPWTWRDRMPALYSVAWSWYSTTTPLVSPVAGMWSVLPWIVCR